MGHAQGWGLNLPPLGEGVEPLQSEGGALGAEVTPNRGVGSGVRRVPPVMSGGRELRVRSEGHWGGAE